VLADKFGNVQNGSAYDTAAVDISPYTKLVLPADAAIKRDGEPGTLKIYMEKTLGFFGHPPKSMSIKDARKTMGCACRMDGESLIVATYGEWDSHIEGGRSMRLLFVVPESVDVETDETLAGEESKGRKWDGQFLTKPKDAENGHWHGPVIPSSDWHAIPDVPDTRLTLREEAT
jgi:hypothetical protein